MTAIDLTCLGIEEIQNKRIISGIGTWLSEILDYLIQEKRQHEYILIVNFYAGEFIRERFPGFEIVEIGGFVSRMLLKYLHKSTETILNKIGYNSWVVDHCKKIDKLWQPFGIPILSYKCNKPVLITVHDFMCCKTARDRRDYHKLISQASHVVTVSEYVRQKLLERYPDVPKNRVTAVPNSIVIDHAHAGPQREPLSDVGKKYVLDINRYEKHKNAVTLLFAFIRYIKDYHDDELELVFVGFGSRQYLEELKTIAAENHVEGRVHFYWGISSEEKNRLLQNATLFVSPSTNEGMGRTPVEAMMFGIPTITTKETSLYEATLGLAVYCEDPYDIRELEGLIADQIQKRPKEDLLREIADKARSEYAIARIWGRYEKILGQISMTGEVHVQNK